MCLCCMLAPVLQMFPSPAALRDSSTRLQLEELIQGCHQGHERGSWSPPYQRLPIYGSFPGPTGRHHAPTRPFLWSHQRCHQSPFFRHQQTCCSIISGPLWWLMMGYNQEKSKSPQPRKSLILREVVLLRLGEQQSTSPGGFNAVIASALPQLV